ncbi:DUF1127 domain-containing protein [Primorskyibacter sp. S187A]|uniref:DUF1127 domain-containing protein n=1 Tax=Primorskyibacter sp. S187A TaxID=3415130 RepID=UPI003C7D8BBA
MAVYDISRAPAASSVFAGRAMAKVLAAVALVNDWTEARATRKMLKALSDRELNDIGLCRADIDTMIQMPARG